MPIKRSADQQSKTLEQYFGEMVSSDNEIQQWKGRDMLAFIEVVNQIFPETQLYGLTSVDRLVVQADNTWTSDWYVIVSALLICKGLTDFETTTVDPEGLEPFQVSGFISVDYTCKIKIRDRRVNYPRFASFRPVLTVFENYFKNNGLFYQIVIVINFLITYDRSKAEVFESTSDYKKDRRSFLL